MLASTVSTLFRRRIGRICLPVAYCVQCTTLFAFSPADSDDNRSFDLVNVQRYLTTDESLTSLPTPALVCVERIAAFEDHEYFAYVFGISQPTKKPGAEISGADKAEILRRIVFIRPQLIVIDSQVHARIATEIALPFLDLDLRQRAEEDVSIVRDGLHFRCRSLLSQGAASDQSDDKSPTWVRSLHVITFAKDREPDFPTCSVQRQGDTLRLEIAEAGADTAADRAVRLWLPDGPGSGRIGIASTEGKKLLSNRLLPAGIFPPDLDAAQRRLQWDLPYQSGDHNVWDTGRTSSEFKRLVESGQIKPCRVVEFGCGTGTDAIYLASQGFDVTAIDIAPTALNIAEQKSAKAGVKVQWLLADILHPPLLEPFDLVYDRGCYHEVRQHDPKAYVAAVKKLTHDGSKIVILAGNANKDTYWRFEGPPRVKEQDIRKDFATGFRLLHLREFRFDPAPPERQGALAWSILLERER